MADNLETVIFRSMFAMSRSDRKMQVTEKEQELIEAIRNLRNSKHNYSWELEMWVRELFERLLESDESGEAQ